MRLPHRRPRSLCTRGCLAILVSAGLTACGGPQGGEFAPIAESPGAASTTGSSGRGSSDRSASDPTGADQTGAARTSRTTSSRAAGWNGDLDLALDVFLPADRAFNEAARRDFTRTIQSLRDSVEVLSDARIVAGLAEAVARSGNAHTRAYVLRNRSYWRRYPIRVWWFDDGLYIVQSRPGLERLIGSRVTAIAGRPIDEVATKVARLYAGNGSWQRYMTTYTLTSPDALLGQGLIEGDGATVYTVERDGSSQEVRIDPLPLDRFDTPTESWWALAPTHEDRTGPWVGALPRDTTLLPLYLRNPTQRYWFATLPQDDAIYFQYNRAGDMPDGEPFASFGERLLATLEAERPSTVVVDVRFNTGGNIGVGWQVFEAIRDYAERLNPGRLAIITGPATFSAGIFHALQLSGAPAAVFLGEWPGDSPQFWSEGGNLVLPHSGLTLHYADGFHTYSPEPRTVPDSLVHFEGAVGGFAPWISVPTISVDYFAGADPVLREALRADRVPGGDRLVRADG